MSMDTVTLGPVQTRPFGTGWSEAVLALRTVLTEPRRMVNLIGLPLLLVMGLTLAAQSGLFPGFRQLPLPNGTVFQPVSTEGWTIWIAVALAGLLAWLRTAVNLVRWTIRGDRVPGFLAPGLRWDDSLALLYAVMLTLGIILVGFGMMLVLGWFFNFLTSFEVGKTVGVVALFAGTMGVYGLLCFAFGRLATGIVPVTLGAPAELATAWQATAPLAWRYFGALALVLFAQWILQAVFSLLVPALPLPLVLVVTSIIQAPFYLAMTIVVARAAREAGLAGGRGSGEAAMDGRSLVNPLAR